MMNYESEDYLELVETFLPFNNSLHFNYNYTPLCV